MKGERRYSKEAGIVVCNCECSRYLHCPAANDNPCKVAYKEHLKGLKDAREKKAAKEAK